MKSIFTLLLLFSLNAFAQQVYLPHEVEKVAEPAGGASYFNQFVNVNLQIPFRNYVKGINNRVYIKGVVEPDGSLTNLEIARGIDTLCNREALRVTRLYRGWKPAMVKGEPVRQVISYSIPFKSAPKNSYDSTSSSIIEYFNSKYAPAADPAKAEYRTTLPVDGNGYVSGNVKYEQKQGSRWKSMATVPYAKNNIWFKSDYLPLGVDSVQAYAVSARDKNMTSHASEATFQQNGMLLEYIEYGATNKASLQKLYDLSGMVREMRMYSDSIKTEIRWYDNGQISSVIETITGKPNENDQLFYVNAWKRDGTQTIKDGDGHWKATGKTYDGKWVTEEGKVLSGVKNGKWTGKLADSTLHYEEDYELGVLQNGTSFQDGQKTAYTQAQVNPRFKGGLNAMYRFLGSNIIYPADAHRRGESGRVQLSFVVCEDGSLCEYKVEKSAGYRLDEEALRVVRKMNGSWEPGVLRGKPVRVRYNMPINFQTM